MAYKFNLYYQKHEKYPICGLYKCTWYEWINLFHTKLQCLSLDKKCKCYCRFLVYILLKLLRECIILALAHLRRSYGVVAFSQNKKTKQKALYIYSSSTPSECSKRQIYHLTTSLSSSDICKSRTYFVDISFLCIVLRHVQLHIPPI